MNSDLEQILEQMIPHGAPSSLREEILAAVGRELALPRWQGWKRWTGAAVAAGLFLGAALNLGVVKVQGARLGEIYGPEPVPRQLAALTRTIEATVGEQAASWFRRELFKAVGHRRPVPFAVLKNYWIDFYSQTLGKEWPHEKTLEAPENIRDRHRHPGSALPGRQRPVDLDHGFPA